MPAAQNMGARLRTAPAGPDAVQLASAFRPVVVLMDIGLPDRMDGTRPPAKYGSRPACAVPYSWRRRDTAATWTWAAPMRKASPRHLTKPFDPAAFQAMLAYIAAVFASWESDAAVQPTPPD